MGEMVSEHNHNYGEKWVICYNGEIRCTLHNRDEAVCLERYMRDRLWLTPDDPALVLRCAV